MDLGGLRRLVVFYILLALQWPVEEIGGRQPRQLGPAQTFKRHKYKRQNYTLGGQSAIFL